MVVSEETKRSCSPRPDIYVSEKYRRPKTKHTPPGERKSSLWVKRGQSPEFCLDELLELGILLLATPPGIDGTISKRVDTRDNSTGETEVSAPLPISSCSEIFKRIGINAGNELSSEGGYHVAFHSGIGGLFHYGGKGIRLRRLKALGVYPACAGSADGLKLRAM